MIAAGALREGRRQHDQPDATQGKDAEQFGEAQVIADRQTQGDALGFGADDLAARHHRGRFVETCPRHIAIEEMNLAIRRPQFTLRIEETRGIE
jgi:hypothetical protein